MSSVACSTGQVAARLRGIAADWASLARTAVPKPQQYVYPEIDPRENENQPVENV